ncbi:MAG TPA: glycosyltransferase family 4 protein [Candidatus Microsaccharimonas sp.]|jgi:glycosyltransferase involved in cell wall biosynthesis
MASVTHLKKLLIISHDKIGSKMAGPGIRYHFMAEYLAKDFDVTIGFFDPTYLPDKELAHSYKAISIDAYSFENDFEKYDYILALWLSDSMMNFCNVKSKVVIFDIYAPVPVENLAVKLFSHQLITKDADYDYAESLKMYRKFLENGDLFLYSNERQRDFWMGYIFGALQVIPSLYNKRPMYDRFIKAPMGIDTDLKLEHRNNVLRGVIGSIGKDDTILLWTGGIWDWFDAVSLIEAMATLKKQGRTDVKLVFLGTQHPNENTPEMSELLKSRNKAISEGLLDNTVYFLEGWVDYTKRIDYLLEADVAIYTHKPSIETEFSHRTRVLDHILAGLPTIGTRGDYLGDVIEKDELGIMVDPFDSKALVKAITNLTDKKNRALYMKNIEKHRNEYSWARTLEPLKSYLLSDPQKIERLPSISTPLSKKYMAKIKKAIPKPIKVTIKRGLHTLGVMK